MSITTAGLAVWLRTGDVCKALGISKATLYRRKREGFLKATVHYSKPAKATEKSLWNLVECQKVFGTWKAPQAGQG